MSLRDGELIGGHFRVGEQLARGGMAEIYAATDERNGQPVVVKIPRSQRHDYVALFEREAKMLSRIKSPFVTAYIGYARDERGRPCIICERLEGETLAERLRRARVLTLADLAPIVTHVLLGLSDAHAAGIFHRDLSCDNVFLSVAIDPSTGTQTEIAKLLDFGVGKPVDDSGGPMTSRNSTLGSLPYMAPEQWLDPSAVDARADLYAVGTIVFHCLTGRLPFQEKTGVRLIALKTEFAAPTLAEATQVPYPAEATAFIAKALERERELRFKSAADMLAAWGAVLAAEDPLPDVSAPEARGGDGDPTATMTHAPNPKRRPW